MGLGSSDIISIVGICVNALVTIGIFVIVKWIINRVKGPRLSIFDYKIAEIRSEYTEERTLYDRDELLKPKWFIEIPYEIMNVGDTSSKFTFRAYLKLLDFKDKDGNPIILTIRNEVSQIFKPGDWGEKRSSKSFVFITDINYFKWEKAKIEIVGNFYDHKSNKKPIEIDPQDITNPNPINSLPSEIQEKIKNYKTQQNELKMKKRKSD